METKTTRYYKPDLEAAIDQRIKLIEQRIPIVSVAYAEKKQPPLSNEDMGPYFAEFTEEYQANIFILNDGIQTNNLELNRTTDNEQTERDIAELQNQLALAQEEELHGTGNSKNLTPPFQPVRLHLAWIIVAVLSLFEGLMNRPSFSAWGYNLLEAMGMTVAFAALLAIFAHTFERIVKKIGKTVWQQRGIAIALMLFIGSIFWYLADVRSKYLSAMVSENTGNTTSFSPIPFTLLSLLLFIASVVICHFLLPTREQRAAMCEYQEQQKAKQARIDKVADLKAAIESKKAANDEMNRLHNSLQEYGAMLEQRIISHAKRGFELWKKHNFLHRTDGRPKSFDNNEYPFRFKTFFHHVNLM